jgi:MYXO-CTERM domain-containing protein
VFADAEGDPALTFSPPGEEEVRVRVRPYSQSGEYTISVECVPVEDEQPEPEQPGFSVPFVGGCSQAPMGGDSDTSPPSAAALLGLLGLAFLRRRR